MIYRLFRIWANIAIRVFYGKIEVNGLENIPKDVPLLIASNHPNGFLEPIIMACLFPRPLHFMVRGDVFRKKWLKPILKSTNQIPIFRFKDGFSQLRKNDDNLREAYKALDDGAAIILFIEGGTQNIKKLRPFQKGLARMAATYLDREGGRKDLHILPVAINFVSPFVLRSRVVLNVDKAFDAKSYFDNETPRTQQIKNLTSELYDKILPMAFHVTNDERQKALNKSLKFAEGMLPITFMPMVDRASHQWSFFKSVSDGIDALDVPQFQEFQSAIDNLGPLDSNMVKRRDKWPALNALLAILLFVPAMLGLAINIIPGFLAQLLARKVLDENNTVFQASIILSSGVGFYVVYYLLVIGVLCIIFGWKGLLFLLAAPLGFVFLLWKNVFRSSLLKNKYQLSEDQKDKLTSLFSKYDIILPKI